jgi:hypothetical protein
MGRERRWPLLLAALLTAAVVLLGRPAGAEIFVYTDANGVQWKRPSVCAAFRS